MEETGILENPNLTSACYLALNQAKHAQRFAQWPKRELMRRLSVRWRSLTR